jgi:DNA-binding CsgD family transcriptional regulator
LLRLLHEITRFASFLNDRPSFEELLNRLATDFVSHLDPKSVTLASLASAKRFEIISNWGATRNLDFQGLESDLNTGNLVSSLLSTGVMRSNKGSETMIAPITNGKVVAGALIITCEKSPNEDEFEYVKVLSALTSTYIFPKIVDTNPSASLTDLKQNPLTPRQRQVLSGFVEGKTNHELALELGFSISTIRHETMAIFKTLGASDRKEAAKLAQQHNLI